MYLLSNPTIHFPLMLLQQVFHLQHFVIGNPMQALILLVKLLQELQIQVMIVFIIMHRHVQFKCVGEILIYLLRIHLTLLI